jgi:hypothetical protein
MSVLGLLTQNAPKILALHTPNTCQVELDVVFNNYDAYGRMVHRFTNHRKQTSPVHFVCAPSPPKGGPTSTFANDKQNATKMIEEEPQQEKKRKVRTSLYLQTCLEPTQL